MRSSVTQTLVAWDEEGSKNRAKEKNVYCGKY
jgi:hypothetical protein